MIIERVVTKAGFKAFHEIAGKIYNDNLQYRATEDDITKLLVEGSSTFLSHAVVFSYLIKDSNEIIGRFTLINDQRLPEFVQVAFFEAYPQLSNIDKVIINRAKIDFPKCKRIVIGLNGHLNYGAGILLNKFDEPPVFGLPYTHSYYNHYFKDFKKKTMVSYRFPTEPFFEYHERFSGVNDFNGITVRKMNKKNLHREVEIYTYLNNVCFKGHPYWADRDVEEDFELFYPFRFLIKEENLLIAEKDGEPIGFLLWYPDFNQLVRNGKSLGLKNVLHYHLANPINTFRLTEVAVLPKYQVSRAVQAMILNTIPYLKKSGYTWGEGGFIFEENKNSIAMTKRFLKRAAGIKVEPYRRYAVYESKL